MDRRVRAYKATKRSSKYTGTDMIHRKLPKMLQSLKVSLSFKLHSTITKSDLFQQLRSVFCEFSNLVSLCRNKIGYVTKTIVIITAKVEYENKSDTNKNRGKRNHLKIIQTITEHSTWNFDITNYRHQPYWALSTYVGK